MSDASYQNAVVLKDGAAYVALTDMTHEELYRSPDASDVIQHAVDSQQGGCAGPGAGRGCG